MYTFLNSKLSGGVWSASYTGNFTAN